MTGVTSSWSEWLTDLTSMPCNALEALVKGDYRFPSAEGLIIVREEQRPIRQLGGTSTRVRCTSSGREYDLRRLSAGAEAGGLVTLTALEALGRTADMLVRAGCHTHVQQCHAMLIENVGRTHHKLLLCEPCGGDLASYVPVDVGTLSPREVADIGQQLAFGLDHLHSLYILYGGMSAQGVLRGRDGLWKLADFSHSAQLPISLEEWREQCAGLGRCGNPGSAPPEVNGVGPTMLQPETDVWFLGSLLAELLLGGTTSGSTGVGWGRRAVALGAISGASLLDPVFARLWLLLHWLLAMDLHGRPKANEVAALMSALGDALPCELLEEMPCDARNHSCSVARAVVRQLAMDEAVATVTTTAERDLLISRIAGLPLSEVRAQLADPSRIDELCKNCGLELVSEGADRSPQTVLGATSADDALVYQTDMSKCSSDTSTDAGSASSETSDVPKCDSFNH